MTTPHARREAALAAIDVVMKGTPARDAESPRVDFKVERGSMAHGSYAPIDTHSDVAAKELTVEATCFAHTEDGGVLVVGVDDRGAGPDAFVGTSLDTEWLHRRMWEISEKLLYTPEIEVIQSERTAGKRIYLIDVPASLGEIPIDGKLHGRKGTQCVELLGDDARRLLEHRRGYDWSAEGSGLHLSDATQAALDVVRRRYREAHGSAPSDLELLRRLGVIRDGTDDPELNRAGALLLCAYEPALVQLDIRHTRVEGAIAMARAEIRAPLLPGIEEAWAFLDRAFLPSPVVAGLVHTEPRWLPRSAYREALANAVAHRAYRVADPIVGIVIGEPARSFKLESPGGFPQGVDESNIISTQSRPRNRALFEAMTTLRYVEHQGVGIETMYRAMLHDGHRPPEIYAKDSGVVCRLDGEAIDQVVQAFFEQLFAHDKDLRDNTSVAIAIWRLREERYLDAPTLAAAAQSSQGEAASTLKTLVEHGVCEPTQRSARRYRLTVAARKSLAGRLDYSSFVPAEDRWGELEAYLRTHAEVSNDGVQKLLSVSRDVAKRLLRQHTERGNLIRTGERKGARYRLKPTTGRRPGTTENTRAATGEVQR